MTIPSASAPGPRVLVAFASRHGGTRQIAAAIARGLTEYGAARRTGLSAVLSPVQRRPDPAGFDAVVLGSAVYEGRWLEPAVLYALGVAAQLPGDSTWLFSSGLAPAPILPLGDVDDARQLARLVGARGNQRFAGRVERRVLSAAERAAWDAASGAAGDFRPWGEVRAWSEEIAADVVRAKSLAATG